MDLRPDTFDLQVTKTTLAELGLPVSPAAESFLAKYGGTYVYRYTGFRGQRTEICNFDVLNILKSSDLKWFEFYREKLKQDITPIGAFSDRHMILMMTPNGSVYGGFSSFVAKLATSGEEVLLKFCDQDKQHQKVE